MHCKTGVSMAYVCFWGGQSRHGWHCTGPEALGYWSNPHGKPLSISNLNWKKNQIFRKITLNFEFKSLPNQSFQKLSKIIVQKHCKHKNFIKTFVKKLSRSFICQICSQWPHAIKKSKEKLENQSQMDCVILTANGRLRCKVSIFWEDQKNGH